MKDSNREAFEEWAKANGYHVAKNPIGEVYLSLNCNNAWKAWRAAKAQAVPEGFVLVNKKDLVKVLNCVTDDWLVDTDSFEEFKKIESLVQDEVNAMIEPQEQSQ